MRNEGSFQNTKLNDGFYDEGLLRNRRGTGPKAHRLWLSICSRQCSKLISQSLEPIAASYSDHLISTHPDLHSRSQPMGSFGPMRSDVEARLPIISDLGWQRTKMPHMKC